MYRATEKLLPQLTKSTSQQLAEASMALDIDPLSDEYIAKLLLQKAEMTENLAEKKGISAYLEDFSKRKTQPNTQFLRGLLQHTIGYNRATQREHESRHKRQNSVDREDSSKYKIDDEKSKKKVKGRGRVKRFEDSILTDKNDEWNIKTEDEINLLKRKNRDDDEEKTKKRKKRKHKKEKKKKRNKE